MRKLFRLSVICFSAWAALTFIPVGLAQPPAGKPEIDLAKVTDPKTRAAVEEIEKKMAAIKEVMATDIKMIVKDAAGKILTQADLKALARRPHFSYQYGKFTGGELDGGEVFQIQDGKLAWQVVKNSPAMVESMIQSAKQSNLPQTKIDAMAAAMQKTACGSTDLVRLQQAGVLEDYETATGRLWQPLEGAEMDTLKLTGETPTTWIFTAHPNPVANMMGILPGDTQYHSAVQAKEFSATTALTLVINKSDGLLAKMELSDAKGSQSVTFNQVTVNPAQPIPDAYFTYTPPEDAIVREVTNKFIENLAIIK